MARQKRIQFPGAFYHVIARGQKRDKIFYQNSDREKFLKKLFETKEKYNILIHAFVLMENHYHLLLQTPEGNVSEAMHYFNTSYANWFKAKNRLIGSVFQGRFKAILVEKDEYLLILSAYIHLNPVRANIVEKPEDYKWSSCRYYFDRKESELLYTEDLFSQFLNGKAYKEFVYSQLDKKIEAEEIYGENSLLGSNVFKDFALKKALESGEEENIREYSDYKNLKKIEKEEIIKTIKQTFDISEDHILKKKKGNIYRKLLIYGLKRYSSLKLGEIGELIGIDYTGVSESYRRFVAEAEKNKDLAFTIKRFEKRLKSEK